MPFVLLYHYLLLSYYEMRKEYRRQHKYKRYQGEHLLTVYGYTEQRIAVALDMLQQLARRQGRAKAENAADTVLYGRAFHVILTVNVAIGHIEEVL